ncbi:Hypothetical_protein [Hexamita inflata]|uniref:Hypothetical_protein n=1 Tax=Hexamita inflata TaxID=28002 RepID=A0AA86U4Z6_9EUKA|nr:Hypothetical protein HINF_LOCUS27271 [Hexamita inflata]
MISYSIEIKAVYCIQPYKVQFPSKTCMVQPNNSPNINQQNIVIVVLLMYYIQDKQCFVVNILCASDVVKQQKLSVLHPLVYQIILIKKTLFPALNFEALHVAADTLVPRFIYTCKVCNSTLLQNTQFQSLF